MGTRTRSVRHISSPVGTRSLTCSPAPTEGRIPEEDTEVYSNSHIFNQRPRLNVLLTVGSIQSRRVASGKAEEWKRC